MLQHYVLIRYEKSASAEHISEFCRRMLALRSTIEGIEHLEIGRDILHDSRSWDLILIMLLHLWLHCAFISGTRNIKT